MPTDDPADRTADDLLDAARNPCRAPARPARYHHARPPEGVHFGVVDAGSRPRPEDADDPHTARVFDAAYAWLEGEVGFQPMFLAVGERPADRWLTGYQSQFRRVVGWSVATGVIRRRGGGSPNRVMFSWCSPLPGAVWMDFDLWHIVLNSVDTVAPPDRNGRFRVEEIGARERRGIFKPSWAPHRWALQARRNPGCVQAVVPELDLRTADEIWCRNRTTRKHLTALGFDSDAIAIRSG